MANEIHTLNIGNTSYTIQPRVLGPMSTHNINGAQFSASGVLRYDTLLGENPFGPNKSTGYNNAVLSISRYSTDRYTTQLGFSGNGIYARWFNDKTPDATTPWRRFIMDDGVDTLNIATPNFNVISNTLNIDTPNVNVTGTSELHLNSENDIFIGDSESEVNPNLWISANSINISGGAYHGTSITLGNDLAAGEGYSQTVNTYCDIIPQALGGNTVDIGSTNSRFTNIYSLQSYATNGFFQTSDERLKNFGDNIKIDFDALSKLRKAYFTWNDKPNTIHIGVSAQEVREIYPEVVTETDGQLSVDYTKLSVIALAAVDELHKKNVELEARLAKLEAMLLK